MRGLHAWRQSHCIALWCVVVLRMLTSSLAPAGGCFWGLELAYQRMPGVSHTSVGYTGGNTKNPTYQQVCSGRTGHAEAVQVCAPGYNTGSACRRGSWCSCMA